MLTSLGRFWGLPAPPAGHRLEHPVLSLSPVVYCIPYVEPRAVLGTKNTGDPRQTRLSSLAPMEPEYGTWVGWHPGSCGSQRRYLDRQGGFLEEEVIIIVFIK